LPTEMGNLSCRCRPRQAALTLILCLPSSIADSWNRGARFRLTRVGCSNQKTKCHWTIQRLLLWKTETVILYTQWLSMKAFPELINQGLPFRHAWHIWTELCFQKFRNPMDPDCWKGPNGMWAVEFSSSSLD
jgi:hypothetical protein